MSRFRFRFSIKVLLVLMALCAIGMLPVIQQRRIQAAREHFDLTYERWDIGVVILEDVMAASENVASAEASSLWYSRATAHSRHKERMGDIFSDADYRERRGYHPENYESFLKHLEELKAQVQHFVP